MCENKDLKAFLWSEEEALRKENKQVGQSGCGATSILNVLVLFIVCLDFIFYVSSKNKLKIKDALEFQYDFDQVVSQVKINKRIPESDAGVTTLAQYLFSRSVAGMNASELIENMQKVTSNQVTGRFFPFYPSNDLNFLNWLSFWILKGFLTNFTFKFKWKVNSLF